MRDSPEAFAPPPMDLMDCFPAALLQLRDNGQIAHFNLAWADRRAGLLLLLSRGAVAATFFATARRGRAP